MASKQDYRRGAVKQYLLDNMEQLLDNSTLYSIIVESMSADYDGDKFVDKNDHDQINEVTNCRKEVKNTNSPLSANQFRITGFLKKRGGFHILKIIDSYNNRVFEIPHDVVFSEAKINSGEIRWCSSYGETGKRCQQNTNLLLKYEVK